jgi:hypothetical protein
MTPRLTLGEMFRVALLLLFGGLLEARVVLISLDGLGWEAYRQDEVCGELDALRRLERRGVVALGVTPHYPSTTSNTHAALFTGAWGDVNGIVSNSMPALPRAEHTALERINGFRSDGLRAEPLWVAAGRQGVRTVAVQVPQAFPFRPQSVGEKLRVPPVVVNGYQTQRIAPGAVIRESDVRTEACAAPAGNDRCFGWNAGTVKLHGRMRGRQGVYRSVEVWADGSARKVLAKLAASEAQTPHRRRLARYFSDGLLVASVPAVLYFRLFECARDGSRFLLYQSPVQELGIHHAPEDGKELTAALLRAAGGFIGNGPESAVTTGPFVLGAPLWKDGDGTAERRYLEICELATRQMMRHAQWLMARYTPELFIGYLPFPDEMEHAWKGVAVADQRYRWVRRWGYAIVNRYAAQFVAAARRGDHVIFVSDHGMAPVKYDVAINAALRQAGLLEVDAQGKPDPARTRAVEMRNCILLNESGWKGGIVTPEQRPGVLAEVKRVLGGIVDPADGASLIARIYDTPDDAARFGYGGPNGAALCFDYRSGYGGTSATWLPLVRTRVVAGGEHGFDPTRADMQAILVGAGPKIPADAKWTGVRAIDVAPLVARLLGIDPPRDARGKSPLE